MMWLDTYRTTYETNYSRLLLYYDVTFLYKTNPRFYRVRTARRRRPNPNQLSPRTDRYPNFTLFP